MWDDGSSRSEYETRFRKDPWHFSPELELISEAMDSEHNKQQIDFVLFEMKEA